jgi:hypothetical protein
MAKQTELATGTAAKPRVPDIKTQSALLDNITQKKKFLIVNMPEEVTLADINEHPEIWRLIQGNHNLSLREDDHVEMRWFTQRVYAIVDWADNTGVGFLKPDVKSKRDRDRVAYSDNFAEVYWDAGGWFLRRKSDGQRLSNVSHTTAAAAWAAHHREMPVRFGAI